MTDVKFNKTIVENACNFNKWTMQSILDGVDKMRFAFVQRVDPDSSRSHKVVGFNSLNPESFAAKLNLNISNCWAVLKDVLVTILDQEQNAAEYLYMKDPVQYNYKLIHMVKTENEGDDDDEEDEGF